jgi:ribosome-interacting GTPase 1
VIVHEEHEDGNIVIEKHQNVKVIKTDDSSGVTIVSTDEIDDETRKKIEEALGDVAVLFIDGSELSGDEQVHKKREVRIIKKEIDVTN